MRTCETRRGKRLGMEKKSHFRRDVLFIQVSGVQTMWSWSKPDRPGVLSSPVGVASCTSAFLHTSEPHPEHPLPGRPASLGATSSGTPRSLLAGPGLPVSPDRARRASPLMVCLPTGMSGLVGASAGCPSGATRGPRAGWMSDLGGGDTRSPPARGRSCLEATKMALVSSPPASPPPGAATGPPAEELPGVNGGSRHPRVLRRPPASVPSAVLPRVRHLPHVCAGAPDQAAVHHR